MGNREAVMTRERPIIFSAAMVRAILDGRKTQTRRIVKPQPMWDVAPLEYANAPGWWAPNEAEDSRKSPYRVGDVFYVRESARCSITASGEHVVTYRADGAIRVCGVDTDAYEGYGTFYGNVCPSGEEKKDDGAIVGPWRPSIHVPRWAARINLRVTGVRGPGCPQCGRAGSSVIDSRPSDGAVRRRRICLSCRYAFTTRERAEACDLSGCWGDGI